MMWSISGQPVAFYSQVNNQRSSEKPNTLCESKASLKPSPMSLIETCLELAEVPRRTRCFTIGVSIYENKTWF
jgi:hypothetical protein